MTTPTIVADPSEIFPACPTFGFNPEPNYLVKITSKEGGFERRDRKWARPLLKFTGVPLGDRPQADIEDVLYFWHAVGGMSDGFRFKDWSDYKSCRLTHTPSPIDQPLIASGDSPSGSFRLVKQYVWGAKIQEREILRPLGSSIRVANETAVEQHDFHLDEATGLVTPGGSFSGTPTTWGGEFFVWCRFDGQFSPQLTNHEVQNATVQLAEIRVPLP